LIFSAFFPNENSAKKGKKSTTSFDETFSDVSKVSLPAAAASFYAPDIGKGIHGIDLRAAIVAFCCVIRKFTFDFSMT
jgi:hypothetical protein